jgi:competence protein ComEA
MAAGACALALMGGTASGGGSARLNAWEPRQEVKAPLLNINTATAAEFEKLPGVGPAMALRIVEYRQKNGGFKKIEELMNVRGIGEASFLKLKPQIMVAPVRTAER